MRSCFLCELGRNRPCRDVSVRKSAAKEAGNVNPQPRVNTEKAIVKKKNGLIDDKAKGSTSERIFHKKKHCACSMSVIRRLGAWASLPHAKNLIKAAYLCKDMMKTRAFPLDHKFLGRFEIEFQIFPLSANLTRWYLFSRSFPVSDEFSNPFKAFVRSKVLVTINVSSRSVRYSDEAKAARPLARVT